MAHWNPKIVTSGLTFCLDAANIKSYPKSGTSWTDLCSNNSGTLISSPTFQTENGGCIVLDGTSYVSVQNSPDLNLTAFTYCGWIKNTDNSLFWNRVMSKKLNYTDSDGYEISLATVSDMTLYIGGSSGSFATISNLTTWLDYKWHYLAVVFNGTNVKAYCDGVYKGQGSIAQVVSNSRDLLLGRIEGEAELTQWIGKMGHVSMYNRALSENEIKQNHEALRWRFGV